MEHDTDKGTFATNAIAPLAKTSEMSLANTAVFGDYSPTKPGLTTLKEEHSATNVTLPPEVVITQENQSDAHIRQFDELSQVTQLHGTDKLGVDEGSARMQNHRDSTDTRADTRARRRSSILSSKKSPLLSSPSARRKSSVGSTVSYNEFDEFQEPAVDGESDFGDFDDFIDGDFDHDEPAGILDNNDLSLDERVAVLPTRLLPDTANKAELQQYLVNQLENILGTESGRSAKSISADAPDGDVLERTPLTADEPEEETEEEDSPFMLTDRAVSLWKQLTAPPPLQPPDWKRSRIRRLFLVSLGIPVDLDEILPKMTHKKLILPSTRRHRDKKYGEDRRARRKIPPPPEFEVSSARLLCATTVMALKSMTQRDLEIHKATLDAHTLAATEHLKYWEEQRDLAKSEKETFEQVVQNLVQYHKKQKDEEREKASKPKSKSRFSMRGP